MSVFASLGIVLISMLILVSMKLVPGVFSLFYHYASGKYATKKVDDLAIFFLLGAESFYVATFIILNVLTIGLFKLGVDLDAQIFFWIIAGILIALGFSFLLFYFRRGKTTELYISRKTSKNFSLLAKNVKNRSDAFVLGFVSNFPELLFTLPLFLIPLFEITKNLTDSISCTLVLVIYMLVALTPLLFTLIYFKVGNNLANLRKSRLKNKTFFRFFVPILYFLLATLIITFRIFN